jgi:hypothetical protein
VRGHVASSRVPSRILAIRIPPILPSGLAHSERPHEKLACPPAHAVYLVASGQGCTQVHPRGVFDVHTTGTAVGTSVRAKTHGLGT